MIFAMNVICVFLAAAICSTAIAGQSAAVAFGIGDLQMARSAEWSPDSPKGQNTGAENGPSSKSLKLAGQGGDRLVRAFIPPDALVHTGDTVVANSYVELLFLKEPCPLPIAEAKSMLRFWRRGGGGGCWYPTVEDRFVDVDGSGRIHANDLYWEAYPRALLHPDGSVTIIEADYDSKTFMDRVSGMKVLKQMREQQARMYERP